MVKDLVSVIIPLYNSRDYIDETIQSVLEQTYQKFEIIIIDDQSKDGSFEFVKDKYELYENISVHRQEKNCGGPAWGRNLGVRLAEGEFIAFLDADDIWGRQKLELQLEIMKKNHILFCSTLKEEFIGKIGKEKLCVEYKKQDIEIKKIDHNKLLQKNIIPNSSVLLHSLLFDGISFIEDKEYIAVEDFLCWLMIHQKIEYSVQIQSPLLYYRILETSISRSKYSMFKKVKRLLANYKINGKGLGCMQYFYLFTYIIKSAWQRVI